MSLMESLTDLFRVDRQLRGLKGRVESAQRYFDAQTNQLREAESALEELLTRKRHLQATIANLETEGATFDDQLEKFRSDLNNAVTQKQYAAVLTELNTVKTARSKLDDEILERLSDVEALEGSVSAAEAQVTERTKVRAHAEAQFREREQEVGERLKELELERDAAAGRVPATELAVFDDLADVYEGEAMAPIEEIDRRRREYSCAACNMHLPFAQVAGLMSPEPALVCCASCRRILFIQEDLRGALTKK